MERENCWEYVYCGKGPDGTRCGEGKACPVVEAKSLDGLNHGTNGGRICWAYFASLAMTPENAGPRLAGDSKKFYDCLRCPFLNFVQTQEGDDFVFINDTTERLRIK